MSLNVTQNQLLISTTLQVRRQDRSGNESKSRKRAELRLNCHHLEHDDDDDCDDYDDDDYDDDDGDQINDYHHHTNKGIKFFFSLRTIISTGIKIKNGTKKLKNIKTSIMNEILFDKLLRLKK